MFKKIFAVGLIAVALIFVGNNQAEAQDVYVGTSNTTGWACYLMTETIRELDDRKLDITCTLKMVTGSGGVKYINYKFHNYPRNLTFTNSQGYSGKVSYATPIELNMWNTLVDYIW